jgi:hypothetical protein
MRFDTAQEVQTLRSVDARDRAWGVQCTRIKPDGTRCRKWSIKGGWVCWKHGGQLPVVRAAARARVEALAPEAVRTLQQLLEPDVKPEVRLRAAAKVLRLCGITASGTEGARSKRALQRADEPRPSADPEIEALLELLAAQPAALSAGS